MAYGDGGGSNLGNKTVTFKGFSSKADKKNFKLYDFEVAKQDLINRLSVRKGERVENPEFGTIIYDTLFEPFTSEISKAIEEDVIQIVDRDPRWNLDTLRIQQEEYGLNLALEITYVPYNIGESLSLAFNQESGLEVTSNPIQVEQSTTVESAY